MTNCVYFSLTSATHIQHTPVCECCFWGYVKIDKAKVFLNWVQKTKPLQKGLS